MTGPIQPEHMQLDPLSRNVFEALSESDDNPVWKAFVHFICNRNPENAAALSQWSDRTVAAVTDALASVEQMRSAAADFPQSIQAVAASFSDLEDEFLEYIVAGKQSETLLIVSYGRRRRETDAFFIKRFNDMYFAGSTDAIYIDEPYSSVEDCLAYARSFVTDICRNRLISVVFCPPITKEFVDAIIVGSCPYIGTLFTLNGKLCARSDKTPFCELSS